MSICKVSEVLKNLKKLNELISYHLETNEFVMKSSRNVLLINFRNIKIEFKFKRTGISGDRINCEFYVNNELIEEHSNITDFYSTFWNNLFSEVGVLNEFIDKNKLLNLRDSLKENKNKFFKK